MKGEAITVKKRPSFLTRQQFEGSTREYKRAAYVYWLIVLQDRNTALKKAGYHQNAAHVHHRVLESLARTGTLSCKVPAQPARKYTPEVMQEAYATLISSKELLNGMEFYIMLHELGILVCMCNKTRFLQAFKAYCHAQGTNLIVNSQTCLHFLQLLDYPARAAYCAEMQNIMCTLSLDQMVFVDEVTLEECPHPKGASSLRRHRNLYATTLEGSKCCACRRCQYKQ